MKNDMPEEILIYMGAASGHPQILREEQNTVNAVKYVRADLTEPVIDDGLLAEAVERVQRYISNDDDNCGDLQYSDLETLITHAIKTREEPVEVTLEAFGDVIEEAMFVRSCENNTKPRPQTPLADFYANFIAKKYPNGIKIIKPNNRDEEKS